MVSHFTTLCRRCTVNVPQYTSVHKPQQRFLVFKKLCVQQNKGNTKSPSLVQLHLQWL